jgi:hypothetical protein
VPSLWRKKNNVSLIWDSNKKIAQKRFKLISLCNSSPIYQSLVKLKTSRKLSKWGGKFTKRQRKTLERYILVTPIKYIIFSFSVIFERSKQLLKLRVYMWQLAAGLVLHRRSFQWFSAVISLFLSHTHTHVIQPPGKWGSCGSAGGSGSSWGCQKKLPMKRNRDLIDWSRKILSLFFFNENLWNLRRRANNLYLNKSVKFAKQIWRQINMFLTSSRSCKKKRFFFTGDDWRQDTQHNGPLCLIRSCFYAECRSTMTMSQMSL